MPKKKKTEGSSLSMALTKPLLPPAIHTQNGRPAIVPPLRAVRIAQDHGEDPEQSRGPYRQQQAETQQWAQQEDEDQTGW